MSNFDPNLTSPQAQAEAEVSEIPAPGPRPPAHDPPWGFRDLLQVLAFALSALLISHFAALSVYALLRLRLDRLPKLTHLGNDARFVVPVQLVAYVFTVGFIYATVVWKYRRRFWEAIRWKPVGEQVSLFLMAGALLAFGSQLVPVLFPSNRPLPIEKLFSNTASAYLLAAFGILVAPFVEELVFRGMVYPVFERQWGLVAAVVATAALFAGIHGPQLGGGLPQIAAIFGVGLALSYARGRTGSLVPSYLMHLSYNSTLFVLLYVSTDHFQRWPV